MKSKPLMGCLILLICHTVVLFCASVDLKVTFLKHTKERRPLGPSGKRACESKNSDVETAFFF